MIKNAKKFYHSHGVVSAICALDACSRQRDQRALVTRTTSFRPGNLISKIE